MRKYASVVVAIFLCITMLMGCSCSSPSQRAEKSVQKLTIGFVKSVDEEEILNASETIKNLFKKEMIKQGYYVRDVVVEVGSSYEMVGRKLAIGDIDIGFVPGATYVLYEEYCDVILTALRRGLSIESDEPRVWNDNTPTGTTDKTVTYYRALILAGPSVRGQAMAAKVNNGEALSWEELNLLRWGVMNSTSPAGYLYPSLWLKEKYNKKITALKYVTEVDTYSTAFEGLASEALDVICIYADARRDFEGRWRSEFGRSYNIWDETAVIGVTSGIYNDTVCVSKTSPVMDEALKEAIKRAFINIGETEEGKKMMSFYRHEGYVEADPEDYEPIRAAREVNNIK
ncbi:MAG: PhnD/SsuA/transferrin family substrate-binding protein [Butyrivibrio sp.]|nr:PhnD/SsuA/transferrin family substrate-binding protein [Butyrivibrio sp.]